MLHNRYLFPRFTKTLRPMSQAAAASAWRHPAQLSHPALPTRRWPAWTGILGMALLCVALRLPGVSRPLVGNFATKSATYAMIARNWALGRAPIWRPTTDCMAGGDRGWHLLEVPVAAYVAGAGWALCGGSLDVWGRAISIAFSMASVVLIFLLVSRWHNRSAAYAAALTLAWSPVAIIFGQSFMLEASVVCLTLLTLLALELFLATKRSAWLLVAAASFALLTLTKIYMLVLLLPLAAMAWRWRPTGDNDSCGCRGGHTPTRSVGEAYSLSFLAHASGWCDSLSLLACASGWCEMTHRPRLHRMALTVGVMMLASLPAVAWCLAAMHTARPDHPQSVHVFDSLYRSTSVHAWPPPLLTSGGFYLRLVFNLAVFGVAPFAVPLAVIGLMSHAGRRHRAWLAAMLVLVAALPAKFHELQYYTLIVVPPLAVLTGVGWECVRRRLQPPRAVPACCLLAWLAVSMRLAMGPAFTTPVEDRAVTTAGAAAQSLAAAHEPVATMHGASSDLLYYCDHPGWALSSNDPRVLPKLEQCRRQGARWLVVCDLRSFAGSPCARELAALPIVRQGDDYRVFCLSESRQREVAADQSRR